MNNALLSSKDMCWCTPLDFFEKLDREFHFNLDAAATDKSAKCADYFTPADDGLSKDWGGAVYFVTLHTAELFRTGCARLTKKATSPAQSSRCSFPRELIHTTGTTTF